LQESFGMSLVSGLEEIVREGEPLAGHTWFKLGGPAEYFAEPQTVDQLADLVRRCREQELPVRLLGGGSNLLVRDEGVPGMVISLAAEAFGDVQTEAGKLTAGGGAKLGHVISAAVRAGLAGLEPLVGIPGTIGGALHGNAGSRGGDIGQWACLATVMTRTGEIHQRGREDLVFAYRQSSLDELVILSAEFELEEGDPEQLTKRMQKQWIVKKASQPMSHQSAGCIFKNPRGMNAGILIEQAGLKGTKVGGAEISPQHANFIIAESGATAQDVLRLIDVARSRVAERLGVELETEIEVW
jgi:UDP-N-acetylmuramate dehydrogenase